MIFEGGSHRGWKETLQPDRICVKIATVKEPNTARTEKWAPPTFLHVREESFSGEQVKYEK